MHAPSRPITLALLAYLSMACLGTEAGHGFAAAKTAVSVKATATHCQSRIVAHGALTVGDEQLPQAVDLGSLGTFTDAEAGHRLLENALFDSLLIYDARGTLIPSMLARIPTTNNGGIRNGGKTILLRLRVGMRWSNGAEITSADVRFGWSISRNPSTGPLCTDTCALIAAITTPDRYTALLHLTHAFGPVLPEAMPEPWPVAWPGSWKRGDSAGAAQKLFKDPSFSPATVGFPTSGPYRVAGFVPGKRIVLRPMPYYTTRSCGAAIAKLVLVSPASHDRLLRALTAHQVDLAVLPPDDLPGLEQHNNDLNVTVRQGDYLEHLELNHDPIFDGKPNPLANTDVRVALALAIDKLGLILAALRVDPQAAKVALASTFVANGQPFADRSLRGQWDPIRAAYVQPGTTQARRDARTLLWRTPFASGFKLEFYSTKQTPTRDSEMSAIAAAWKPLGVTFDPEYDTPAHLYGDGGRGYTGDFQVALFAYTGGVGIDDYRYALQSRYIDRRQASHSLLNGNFAGVDNRTIDAAYDRAGHTFDLAARSSDYAVVQAQVNRRADWVPLYFRPYLVVHNVRIHHFSNGLDNLYAWSVTR